MSSTLVPAPRPAVLREGALGVSDRALHALQAADQATARAFVHQASPEFDAAMSRMAQAIREGLPAGLKGIA